MKKAIKTKLSGIADTASFGFSLGSEIEISKSSAKDIRAMFRGSSFMTLASGDPRTGNSIWMLWDSAIREENEFACRYEFKIIGGRTFLNATGNPTRLAVGRNDMPVIVKGFDGKDGNSGNSAYNTFRFLNRLVFIILERIPSTAPFKWVGEDLQTFQRGEINIKQSQHAWYSNDLGSPENRDAVLNYLRSCYSGNSVFEGRVANLASYLNLNTKNHDNSSNMSIEALTGKEKLFSLTLYAKDTEGKYLLDEESANRVATLIRYDCTFRPRFLETYKIRKVRDLEERYLKECELNGYDIGFYKWLSDKVINRLKLQYVCALTSSSYDAMLDKCGEIVGKTQRKLIDHWLDRESTTYSSTLEKCEALGINPKHYADAAKAIEQKTGIDIDLPRDYYRSMLDNRIMGRSSPEEVDARLRGKGKSNKVVTYDELKQRDLDASAEIDKIFAGSTQVVKMRKLVPVKVHKDKLYLYEQFKKAG